MCRRQKRMCKYLYDTFFSLCWVVYISCWNVWLLFFKKSTSYIGLVTGFPPAYAFWLSRSCTWRISLANWHMTKLSQLFLNWNSINSIPGLYHPSKYERDPNKITQVIALTDRHTHRQTEYTRWKYTTTLAKWVLVESTTTHITYKWQWT